MKTEKPDKNNFFKEKYERVRDLLEYCYGYLPMATATEEEVAEELGIPPYLKRTKEEEQTYRKGGLNALRKLRQKDGS